MNRPDAYYYNNALGFDLEQYALDLDAYCDCLEKALDKACDELEFTAKEINKLRGYMDDEYIHKEEWKEWSFKECVNQF